MIRIMVEPTMGRLARWLRLMGYDAPLATAPPPRMPPGQVYLTRTTRLADRPGFQLVTSERPARQLRQVEAELGLKLDPQYLFTRCLDCNQPVQPLSREQARGLVPDYTLSSAASFSRCPGCGRVFWPGSHGKRALAQLQDILDGQNYPPTSSDCPK